MSKLLSLKLNDGIFLATEKIVKTIHMPRNAYINQALDFFNKLHQRKFLSKVLRKESAKVARNSLALLNAFESFEDEIP